MWVFFDGLEHGGSRLAPTPSGGHIVATSLPGTIDLAFEFDAQFNMLGQSQLPVTGEVDLAILSSSLQLSGMDSVKILLGNGTA